MSELVKAISDEQFEQEVVNSDVPVLVDFWAPWCGPCKSMLPVVENVAKEMAGQLKVVKIDINENSEVANANNVRSIPNFIIYKGGVKREQFVGARDKSDLMSIIKSIL